MKKHTPAELAGAMRELQEQSDRGMAIIAASLLEHHLGLAIEARMLPLNSKLRDNIFGPRGTLAGFQSKIDVGFALGLFSQHGHRDLDTIRRIRNRFAHTPIQLNFQDPEIKKLALSLMPSFLAGRNNPRERLTITYLGLHALLIATSQQQIQVTEISEIFPNIATDVAAAVFGSLPEKS
jgi:hypothetical protein